MGAHPNTLGKSRSRNSWLGDLLERHGRSKNVVTNTVLSIQIQWRRLRFDRKVKFSWFFTLVAVLPNGAILAAEVNCQNSETDMQVICSWCRGEGRVGLVGEKAPLEDRRETHSICIEHEKVVRARWTGYQGSVGSCRTSGMSLKDPSLSIRRVVRSVVRFYAGLRDGLPKICG